MSVLVLSTTTMSIEAFLAGSPSTTQPPFVTAWADNNGVAFTEGELDGALNSANPVTIVAAPASGTRRIVRSVIIYNADTAAITITMRINNNGTYRILYKQTISPGDSFDWPSGIVAYGIDPTLYALTSYVDGKVLDSIADADTTHAPSRNSVYDALALKAPLNSPSFVTPALGTPVSGDFRNCSAPTTTEKGVTVYSGSTKALAGTDTASAMTPADVAAAIAVNANPKAMSQGVALTAATTGSNGIRAAHDARYANTTNSFGFAFNLLLPSYTTAAVLKNKFSGSSGVKLEQVVTSGIYRLTINTKTYDSTVPGGGAATNLVAGTKHNLAVFVTVGATTTTVSFYLDYVLLNTTAAQANETISNSDIIYLMGTSSTRTAGTISDFVMFNRAYTATEVADLRNGIAEADKWGSQTSLATGTDSNFSGAGNWINTACAIFDVNTTVPGKAYMLGDGGNDMIRLGVSTGNSRYFVSLKARRSAGAETTIYVGRSGSGSVGTSAFAITPTDTEQTFVGFFDTTNALYQSDPYGSPLYIGRAAAIGGFNGVSFEIDDVFIYKLGATLALESDNAQPIPGMWLDSSTNNLHAIYPAAGASLTRPKDSFVIRWVNTWAASHEAQYLGGIDQAMLPPKCCITSIVGVIAGSTIEDIILGDGSDTDHWVAITSGLAAGTVNFTIANAFSNLTNYKLVVDPDANFTGSITWTIRGYIYQ